MIQKILLSVLVVVSAFTACKQDTTSESKEILFVCTHGAARSPIAAAYFNQLAEVNDLDFHAVFRGTEPDEKLTTETIVGLTKDHFDIYNWKPRKVAIEEVENAYKVITFDCAVPSKTNSTPQEAWNGTPSISKDYDTARNAIKARVEQLIDRLSEE